ncbi:hypothetical protein EDF88_4159 [Buttiauxella sp. BIGb0552]|uniref:hypothetical protein n=1 Tax=Buttiauxella sp. BIGb0552 TaxID=2485120 RepID=UPI001064CCCD|nr:hypothetical protein [Buttiauxella sp. BIGb0552]TDX14833.1 hypothetical protein EDF88_4159 [Buttiauxella sp. BIGb0552]
MSNSLAYGAKLTPESFADFVQRLKYHSRGKGVNDHCTADAIFIVQRKRLVNGIDADYTDQLMVYCDDWKWFSIQEYWDDLDSDAKVELNKKSQDWCEKQFMKADSDDQWYLLGELEDHTVTGYQWEWEYVNSHFTREAAQAFIQRKKHDYPDGMRIYVDANIYCWEFNAIKEALMDGRLVLSDGAAK